MYVSFNEALDGYWFPASSARVPACFLSCTSMLQAASIVLQVPRGASAASDLMGKCLATGHIGLGNFVMAIRQGCSKYWAEF